MPPVDPALLSEARILAAYLIFLGSYFVFALGKFPWMKIDRPGAAIIGAVLMVAFRIVGPGEALQSIDFSTIVLLFSMMLVVANLRVGGFFERVAEWAIERLHPHHLLPTVVFTTGLLSAFLVNDIVCLVMTPFVVHMTQRLRLPPVPYVVAVATASNIGSVATITGNPQNMLIGSRRPVHHRRRCRARRVDGSTPPADREMGVASNGDLRTAHRGALEHRQQRAGGHAAAHAGQPVS
jgi:Na+/H+ antiporter NhaD/arsenite permease-like protein